MLQMSAWYFYDLFYIDLTTSFLLVLRAEMVEEMDIDWIFLLFGLCTCFWLVLGAEMVEDMEMDVDMQRREV